LAYSADAEDRRGGRRARSAFEQQRHQVDEGSDAGERPQGESDPEHDETPAAGHARRHLDCGLRIRDVGFGCASCGPWSAKTGHVRRHGDRGEQDGESRVGAAPAQDRVEVSGDGCEDGAGEPGDEGEGGEGSDVVGVPPASQRDEGGRVQGGAHRGASTDPGEGKHDEAGGVGNAEESHDAEQRPGSHDAARALAIEPASDSESEDGGGDGAREKAAVT